jgi:phosphate transport system substrate-binding protein
VRSVGALWGCALAVLLGGCGAGPGAGKITASGSSTVSPIVSELGKKFEKLHSNVRVDVQTGGSSRGIADVRGGVVDIGLVSRALKADEADLKAYTIAMDGVCVILHKDNPVKELSDAQVVSIYTGKVTNWKDVGGNNAQIVVVNKAEGRSTLELFAHYYKIKNSEIKAHVVIGDNEQAVKTVVGNANAIGYVSIGTAEYNAKSGTPIKLLAVGGVEPTLQKVREGKFPLSRPLNVVTKGDPNPLVKTFIEFLCSSEANEVIKEQFFVPIK